MNEKLDEFLELRAVRCSPTLKRKLEVLRFLSGLKMPDQIRVSLTRAVDDEMRERGKPAFDLLCGETLEIQQPGPKKAELLGNVGNRRRA